MMALLEMQYFPARATTLRDERTRNHYRRSVRWLGDMLGRPAKIADLTDDHLTALLGWLLTVRHQQEVTANTSRKCLCALWRWCRDRGLIATGPTADPLPTPQRAPRAFSRDDLQRLVRTAATMPGSICGMPARFWWLALLAIEWDTGARAAELLSLRWEWLDWQTGWLTSPAEYRKGKGSDAVYWLAEDTRATLRPIARQEGPILNWTLHRSRYWQLWSDLLRAAGLPVDRRHKTQCLRRSFASWLRAGGGDPVSACGHSSAAVTSRYYLDPRLTAARHADAMPFRLLDLRE